MIKRLLATFYISLLMLTIISCEKITGPANIKINFGFQVSDSLTNVNDLTKDDTEDFPLIFEEGQVIVHSINFEGSREEGENVVFTSNFDTVIIADLVNGSTNFPVVFDVPQGTYSYINLSVYINNVANIPALSIAGKYTGDFTRTTNATEKNDINFNYAFYEKEILNLTVQSDQYESIVISEANVSTIKISIDPEFIFQNTISKFEDADITVDDELSLDNSNIILVSKDTNTNIYEETISGNRLEKASWARLINK